MFVTLRKIPQATYRVLSSDRDTTAIDVVNLWRNRLIGDAAKPADERVTRTTIVAAPTEPLLPSGLLGPVRLVRAGGP